MMRPVDATRRRFGPVVAVLAVLAGGLAAVGLSDFAVTHWDEGLALRGARYFATLGREGHYSPTHSPPLFSGVLGLLGLGVGLEPSVLVFWNVALFGLSVVLVAALGRSLGSPLAGLLAAALFAGSGLHLMFARSLLTETTYAFFLLLSLLASVRALRSEHWGAFLATGLAVACLQATKYNGCLAALPLGFVLLVRFLRTPEDGAVRTLLWRWALVGGPAGLLMIANLGLIAWKADLDAFLKHYSGYVGDDGTTLRGLVGTLRFALPVSLLVAAVLGWFLTLRRSWRLWLLHVAAVLYVAFVFRYALFLRLVVPIATLAVVYAALGVDALRQRLPRRAGTLLVGLYLVGFGVEAWSMRDRHFLRRFDGYARAAAWLEDYDSSVPRLFATQDFVWGDLPERPPVFGLPSDGARAILERADEALLIVDIGAFSRLRPWDLGDLYAELDADWRVARFENGLNLDALQNNLELEELQRLSEDPELQERVLSIHVFRVPSERLLSYDRERRSGG